jgi:hypothetical protein
MDRGRFYKISYNGPKSDYIRDYGVYSFEYVVERLSVSFVLDKYERFALSFSDDLGNPSGVFVPHGIKNDDVEQALAEDYGIDIHLVD